MDERTSDTIEAPGFGFQRWATWMAAGGFTELQRSTLEISRRAERPRRDAAAQGSYFAMVNAALAVDASLAAAGAAILTLPIALPQESQPLRLELSAAAD